MNLMRNGGAGKIEVQLGMKSRVDLFNRWGLMVVTTGKKTRKMVRFRICGVRRERRLRPGDTKGEKAMIKSLVLVLLVASCDRYGIALRSFGGK